MVVPVTTIVGRAIGSNILQYLFQNHKAKRTWNGKFDARSIFLKNGFEVDIRASVCDFTHDAALNDLIAYVDKVIPFLE